jgi:hypothetical protein
MEKKYSFPSLELATSLVLDLKENDDSRTFRQVTVTPTTKGVVCLGFINKYAYNEETEENEIIEVGTTFSVDVYWYSEPNEDWNQYEITPNNPIHTF